MPRQEFEQLVKSIAQESRSESVESIYPVTIVKDRYHGGYSGAQWLAFNVYDGELPEDVGADDSSEGNFFRWDRENGADKWLIGYGDTPDEALEDLVKRVNGKKSTIETKAERKP